MQHLIIILSFIIIRSPKDISMKQLWRRAAGKIKDRNSILKSSISFNAGHKNPELERSVIIATSHDDSYVDYNHAQRVFMWVRTSPSYLIILLRALSSRIECTQDWVVALKSIILLHGVLCTQAPGTRKIGRLPFDLSGFKEGYIRDGNRREARSKFVQSYFMFLDLKSVTLSDELKDEMALPMMVDERDEIQVQLVRIKRWQDLLDTVLHVRPRGTGTGMTNEVVVLEAMDCMVSEVLELYSKICDEIATALMEVYANRVGKVEASMALELLHKANKQGRILSDYFEFCQQIGLLPATECPKLQQIPEEDFIELEKIIDGTRDQLSAELTGKADLKGRDLKSHENNCSTGATMIAAEKKIINQKSVLKTVITDKWEVFDEDMSKVGNAGALVLVDHPFAENVIPEIHFNPFIDYVDRTSHNIVSLL